MSDIINYLNQPIAAACTHGANNALSVFRLSGELSHRYFLKLIKFKNNKIKLANIRKFHRLFLRCELIDPKTDQTIDDGMCVFFCAPHSYTAENSVELYLHGSAYIIQKSLELFYSVGFRAAEPGEFTQRAYLNSKLDLTQAEGIYCLANSHSKSQWHAARYLCSGKLAKHLQILRDDLLHLISNFEAYLDFPEEPDIIQIAKNKHKHAANELLKKLQNLLKDYQSAKISSDGLNISLIGKPNAGKSSLINSLSKQQRSIVTDTPGTTRDYLKASYIHHGYKLNIFDTAGVRSNEKSLPLAERLAIKKSLELMVESDLICILTSASDKKILDLKYYIDQFDLNIDLNKLPKIWHIITKADLIKTHQKLDFVHLKDSININKNSTTKNQFLLVSTHASENIITTDKEYSDSVNKLNEKFVNLFKTHENKIKNSDYVATARQKSAIQMAISELSRFLCEYDNKENDDILAHYLRNCKSCLLSIVGQIGSDEILSEVFSKFCIGK